MTVQFGPPLVGAKEDAMDSGGVDCGPVYQDYLVQSPCYSEHSVNSVDASAYAYSPNSLYMYEQERSDMANSFNTCTMDNKMDGVCDVDVGQLSPGMETRSVTSWRGGENETCPMESIDAGQFVESWAGKDLGLLNMDDVFQVDSNDVKQGPTLAELNSEDSLSFLEDVGNYSKAVVDVDTKLHQPMKQTIVPLDEEDVKPLALKIPTKNIKLKKTSDPCRSNLVPTVVPQEDTTKLENYTLSQLLSPAPDGASSLTKLASKPATSVVKSEPVIVSESGPMDRSLLKMWEEIKQFIHGEPEEARSSSTITQAKLEHENENAMEEHDEDWNENSDHSDDEDDDMSDFGSQSSSNCSLTTEQVDLNDIERPFWQYNAQSKGPKGAKLCLYIEQNDPHVLNQFHDPVFDPGQRSSAGIVHGGKQRRGDGNDVVPNPKKMYSIGMELKKLNKAINDMTPVSELPLSARPRSRREKNKLASRACRLKKKAQHEANKVKLFGLEREHEKLNSVLNGIRKEIGDALRNPEVKQEETMSSKLQNLIQKHLTHMIAGHTTEYVNSVLDKVATGDPRGGLRN